MRDPTVYIVDDDPDMRDSLRWLLKTVGLRSVTFSSAAEFLRRFSGEGPACLVLDVRMPGTSGLDLFEELTARGVRMPVLFITAYADVPMAVRAMKSGAVEFLEKPFNGQVLLEKIQRAVEDDADRSRARPVLMRSGSRLETLTGKEREVLGMIRDGRPNKEIAARLEVTPRAVELRRASLMRKLGVSSLPELLRLTIGHEAASGRSSALALIPIAGGPAPASNPGIHAQVSHTREWVPGARPFGFAKERSAAPFALPQKKAFGGFGTTAAFYRLRVSGAAPLPTGCEASSALCRSSETGRTTPGEPGVFQERHADGLRRGSRFPCSRTSPGSFVGPWARRLPDRLAPDRAGRPERRRAVRAVPRARRRAAPGPVLLGPAAGEPARPRPAARLRGRSRPLLGLQGVRGGLPRAERARRRRVLARRRPARRRDGRRCRCSST